MEGFLFGISALGSVLDRLSKIGHCRFDSNQLQGHLGKHFALYLAII